MIQLFYRDLAGEWILVKAFPTYYAAVRFGQSYHPNNFNVDTGDRVPSREEQLLLPLPESRKAKLENFLANL